jgi:hypothetical protein
MREVIKHDRRGCGLTNPLHRFAARLRFGVTPKGLGSGGKR